MTLISFYIYSLKTTKKNTIMIILFCISGLLFLFSAFGAGFSFSFKETYKEYYKLLFVNKEYKRPYDWPFSRRKNHREFVGFIWLMSIFFLTTIVCCIIIGWWIPLVLSIILALITYCIGIKVGKKECQRGVKESCESYNFQM